MNENVLIASELHLEHLRETDENLHGLYMLDGSLNFEPYGLALRKNWSLAPKVDDLIFRYAARTFCRVDGDDIFHNFKISRPR